MAYLFYFLLDFVFDGNDYKKMKINCAHTELVDIETLIQNPRNPNKHPEKQLKYLAKIMKHQGWRSPIVVSKRSGFIVKGHGRLAAAKINGWTQCPVDFQEYANEADEYADLIADNKIAELAESDELMIQEIALDLGPDFDFDLLGIPDFKVVGVDTLPPGDPDEVPEPPAEPKTKLGDIYKLGNHRLMCGDSTSIDDVDKLMAGEKADMCFTSPPYNAGISSKLTGNTSVVDNFYGEGYDDNKTEDEWLQFTSQCTSVALKYCRYVFWNVQFLSGNRTALPRYWSAFKDYICDVGIWDKGHAQPAAAPRVLNSVFEFIFIFTSDKNPNRAIRIAPEFRGTIPNIFRIKPQSSNEFSYIHAATFPVQFPETFISYFCPVSGSVLDLFGGTGTTIIACEKTNRKCFMMELDPRYVSIIIERWCKYTGKEAYLLNEDGTQTAWSKIKSVEQ